MNADNPSLLSDLTRTEGLVSDVKGLRPFGQEEGCYGCLLFTGHTAKCVIFWKADE